MSTETERVAARNLTVNGITKTYAEWARPLGISPVSLKDRIQKRGIDPEKAVTMKKQKRPGKGITILTARGIASARRYRESSKQMKKEA